MRSGLSHKAYENAYINMTYSDPTRLTTVCSFNVGGGCVADLVVDDKSAEKKEAPAAVAKRVQ